VRQLQNTIRSTVVLNDGELVTAEMLPKGISAAPASFVTSAEPPPPPSEVAPQRPAAATDICPLEEVIKHTIESAIDTCGGSIPKAAAALQVSPSTIYRRIEGWRTVEGQS
jgi:two-component system repressor protein LuxO